MDVRIQPTYRRRARRPFRFSLKTLVMLTVFCLLPLSCIPLFRNSVGHNVPHADAPIWGLPDDASNVSYFIHGVLGPSRLYEFNTTEESFREWIDRFNVERPRDCPCRIVRYTAYVDDSDAQDYADIEDGIMYEWVAGDSGVHLAFDRKTGRAYYFSHSR